MASHLLLIYFTICIAFIFNFLNGFNDAANAIATIVSTQVLKPHQAVLWSAVFNFLAYFVFGLHVANTVGTGIVAPTIINTVFILSALMGAILWNIITWYFAIPSSSSHALIGGLIGAAVMKSGTHYLEWSGIIKVVASIFLSPLLGMVLGMLMMFLIARIFFYYSPSKLNRGFRFLQLMSSALLSLGHGGNDGQKSMGIIAVLLFSSGLMTGDFYVPHWVIFSCYATMAFGTLFGGYRIVRTMGMKITKIKPVGGCCAETGTALTLFLATILGIPVSTTHIVAGSIVGVGSLERFSAVRWGVASQIVWAWVLTLPASAIVAALVEFISLKIF
ncbi:MAG: inorganic phosphate transporter [Gammaproteobacteria bacterium]|nr:inorganic phosphate transporter [Gammaproteobacteria bacterium]